MEHLSSDGYPVEIGKKFWNNDLKVAEITRVAAWSNPYSNTGCTQTWHNTSNGSFDTLDGSMRPYGRLGRYYNGRDAETYPPGTAYADVK